MSSQYCRPTGSDPVWHCPVCGQWWRLDLPCGDFWEPMSSLTAFLFYHVKWKAERKHRKAGFTRPQAGSIMDAEQSDELAEAYEQGKQAVFDAMNHFDELAIVERANPYRKDGR